MAEQQLLNQLITLLLADGRTEDLKKSASAAVSEIRGFGRFCYTASGICD